MNGTQNTAELYLDLLEKVVTNVVYEDAPIPNEWFPEQDFRPENRETGTDWPSVAHTMVGLKRIRNIRTLLDQVVADGVPGDFIETGVWRGGLCIFARGYFKAHGITDRTVWLADSFEGIPVTGDESHPMDQEMALHRSNDVLGVSADTVRENFGRYGLLDDQVRFLPGWFKDTLPTAPVEQLAVLRLDGDLYESTLDALDNLYPKLSTGGFVVIDDYFIPACRKAVDEFREKHGITDEVEAIDDYSVFWRRSA
ncbi:TylF/MycF family methyltransferase [Streptomyces sp. TBY4]|uniref:TylF/MycF family methyltransferase n=1 Tax=Streptomyces sp. TBY4 TaxID=2962030 RepID=UPI0020B7CF23|nr:TylF/MycF family methyltransferase [Streptomyces sp. TBY4]MCP3759032.1 TylF/MycF family methyltransferase [Streptomyces sp. TBY4]